MAFPPEHRRSILIGLSGIALGAVLVLVGVYVVGASNTTAASIGAGFITLAGMTSILLAVFFFVLPPLLPAK